MSDGVGSWIRLHVHRSSDFSEAADELLPLFMGEREKRFGSSLSGFSWRARAVSLAQPPRDYMYHAT